MTALRKYIRMLILAWLVGIFLILMVQSAFSAGKSPGDCKAENCEEWDESAKDCVPIPKNCWGLVKAGTASSSGCGACSGAFCDPAVDTFTYDVAVETCKGSESYTSVPNAAYSAKYTPCETVPDTEALANAFQDLVDCCANSPVSCIGNTVASIVAVQAAIASGGTAAMAFAALGADSVADMLLSLCNCISCAPCDYVTCEIAMTHGIRTYDYVPWVFLSGAACP